MAVIHRRVEYYVHMCTVYSIYEIEPLQQDDAQPRWPTLYSVLSCSFKTAFISDLDFWSAGLKLIRELHGWRPLTVGLLSCKSALFREPFSFILELGQAKDRRTYRRTDGVQSITSHCSLPQYCVVSLLIELLFVKLWYFSVPCLSQDEVSYAIHLLCTDRFYFLFDCILLLC